MNKVRRTKIKAIITKLEEVENNLSTVKADEEWAFDCMPEGLQSSLRGEQSEEAVENMDEAIDKINEAIDFLSEIC